MLMKTDKRSETDAEIEAAWNEIVLALKMNITREKNSTVKTIKTPDTNARNFTRSLSKYNPLFHLQRRGVPHALTLKLA